MKKEEEMKIELETRLKILEIASFIGLTFALVFATIVVNFDKIVSNTYSFILTVGLFVYIIFAFYYFIKIKNFAQDGLNKLLKRGKYQMQTAASIKSSPNLRLALGEFLIVMGAALFGTATGQYWFYIQSLTFNSFYAQQMVIGVVIAVIGIALKYPRN